MATAFEPGPVVQQIDIARSAGSFWTAPFAKDPKLQFRFRVHIEGMQFEDLNPGGDNYQDSKKEGQSWVWYAKSISKPTMFFTPANEGEASRIGSQQQDIKILSAPQFKAVDMTLVDPSYPNATRKLLRLIRRAGYNDEAAQTENGHESFDFGKHRASVGRVYYDQLDQHGVPLEQWELISPFITSIDFGKLDYSSNDLAEINISWGYSTIMCTQYGDNDASSDTGERTFSYFKDYDPEGAATFKVVEV